MAQVVLIYPKTGADIRGVTEELPLSILSAGSLVSADFDTVFLDQRIAEDMEAELPGHIDRPRDLHTSRRGEHERIRTLGDHRHPLRDDDVMKVELAVVHGRGDQDARSD